MTSVIRAVSPPDPQADIMTLAKKQDSTPGPPDGGYGWVVLAACAACLASVVGMARMGGLVFVEIIDIYQVSRTQASIILVTLRMFTFLSAPLLSKLLTKFSYRFILFTGGLTMGVAMILSSFATAYWQLLLTYGFLLGSGTSCIMVSTTLIVGLYFTKRRSLAMGILYSVGACGGFTMPIVFTFLLEMYRFHGALLIVGALMLHSCPLALLVRQPWWLKKVQPQMEKDKARICDSQENGVAAKEALLQDVRTDHKNDGPMPLSQKIVNDENLKETDTFLNTSESRTDGVKRKSWFRSAVNSLRQDLRIFKDGIFILQLINRMFIMVTIMNFLLLLPDFVERDLEAEITKQEVAFMLSMSSVGDIIMRFVIGVFLDKLPWAKKHSYGGLSVAIGVLVLSFQFAETYTHLLIGNVMFGVLTGTCVVIQFILEVDLMGTERARICHGITQFCIGITNMFGGILIGYLRDRLGNYQVNICWMGSMAIIGGLIWLLEPLVVKCLPPVYQPEKKVEKEAPDVGTPPSSV